MGCNYLSLPLIPASGTRVLKCIMSLNGVTIDPFKLLIVAPYYSQWPRITHNSHVLSINWMIWTKGYQLLRIVAILLHLQFPPQNLNVNYSALSNFKWSYVTRKPNYLGQTQAALEKGRKSQCYLKVFGSNVSILKNKLACDIWLKIPFCFKKMSSENSRRLVPTTMGLLPDTRNYGLRMRRECRERFPRHRLPLVIR